MTSSVCQLPPKRIPIPSNSRTQHFCSGITIGHERSCSWFCKRRRSRTAKQLGRPIQGSPSPPQNTAEVLRSSRSRLSVCDVLWVPLRYVENVITAPGDARFWRINAHNDAFFAKVRSMVIKYR